MPEFRSVSPAVAPLETSYVVSCLPNSVRKVIKSRQSQVEIIDNKLVLRFARKETAAKVRLLHNEIVWQFQCKRTLPRLDFVRYEWGSGEYAESSLIWRDEAMNTIDLGNLPRLKPSEVMRLFNEHETAYNGLPGSCVAMESHRVVIASDNIHRSAGYGPIKLISEVLDGSIYFPPNELDGYTANIIKAAGSPVELVYYSARADNLKIYRRHVSAFMAIMDTESGEPHAVRVVRMLKPPEDMGRVLELKR